MIGNDIFLTAEWRKLILANYEVPAAVLTKYLPSFTKLDAWNGKYYVSLVGFMFQNTKLKGFGIPFHGDFEEVNLRFYVTYNDGLTEKRGVVFIKEFVPKPAITFIANTIYREKYQTFRMKHKWEQSNEVLEVSYGWKNKNWNQFTVRAEPNSVAIASESEEEFITEHYWGYTKISKERTSEYGVQHPRWEVYPVKDFQIDVDFGFNYGSDFEFLNQQRPNSVMLAEGSEIRVMKGRKIR